MLEQDQDTSTAGSAQTPATWDLPRYFNKLISRSCVSLCDSHQVNVTSATINQNSGGGKCSTASGWGSASCLNCRNTIHKRLNGKGCVGIKINQSSLVTLLNLAVDSGGYETIYQLVDRSLLVDDDFQIDRSVSLAQRLPVADGSNIVGSQESDDGSISQEIVMSFQWWISISRTQWKKTMCEPNKCIHCSQTVPN